MIEGLIGKKIGMTHLFGAESRVVPVTVLELGPCVVTQLRTQSRDGYEAVQIGYGRVKQLSNPARGHLRASGAEVKHLHEFGATDLSEFHVGQTLSVSQFQEGDLVDVGSTTKGRGFQGVMKRHGFGGGKATHGQSDRARAPGSIGAGTFPGRVVKGKRMPGHMGNRHVTQRKLRVEQVDPERNLIMVLGSVPGPRNVLVTVRYAKGEPVADRLSPPELEVPETPEVAEEPTVAVAEVVTEDAPVTEAEEAPADAEDEPVEEQK
jgi:large subunit ribosomal protein L3